MKFLSYYAAIMMCGAMLVFGTACGDDEDNTPKDPTEYPNDPEDPSDNPDNKFDENKTGDKQYLEETAKQFLNCFNANDQRDLLNLAVYFGDEYGEYGLPEDFGEGNNPRSFMRTLAQGKYNVVGSRAATLAFNMASVNGIYEPGRYEAWVKTGESDKCIFRFKDDNGKTCEISVAAASKDSWSYARRIDGDNYSVEVPKTLIFSITCGNNTLVSATIKSNFVDGSSFNVNVEMLAANIYCKADVNGNNSQITSNATISVGNTTIATGQATVTGTGLCSVDGWENKFDNYDSSEALARIITGGSASTTVMGRVTLDGKIVNIQDYIEYSDFWADSYDYSDPEKEAKTAAALLSSSIDVKMKYNGSNKTRATIAYEAYLEYSYYSDYYNKNMEFWELRPIINFTSDNSAYDFESYFGNGRFFSVEDLFESIAAGYERYF